MDHQSIFAHLRDVLASLYPTETSARRVADDAGLAATRVRFNTQAQENWHAILIEATHTNKIDALLTVVRTEYGDNPDFVSAYKAYDHLIRQGKRLMSPSASTIDTARQIDNSLGEKIEGDSSKPKITESTKNVNVDEPVFGKRKSDLGEEFIRHDKLGAVLNNLFEGISDDIHSIRNRQVMLSEVYNIWIKGVLEQSLYNQVLIDLGMDIRPEAVIRPWDMMLEIPSHKSRRLPAGTKIINIFDEMNHSLLILGEPGSGKTTMLLELLRDLVERAKKDRSQPIPAVFNLSSWSSKRQPIHLWLIDELKIQYHIPVPVARAWVSNDELLLLLDGLDEVNQEYRDACVIALNQFQQERTALLPMAICGRTVEYDALINKLQLRGAIVLQPLTIEQIDLFLFNTKDKLLAVRQLLRYDTVLQELAQSPLMLSIMSLAYQNQAIESLQSLSSSEAHRKHLFDAYVQQMFKRKAQISVDLYPYEKTLYWLVWLAKQMIFYSQTIFLIEGIQPTWFVTESQKMVYKMSVILNIGLLVGLVFGISGELLGGLSGGLLGGLLGILIGGLSGEAADSIKPTDELKWNWGDGLLFGILGGVLGVLFFGLFSGLFISLIFGTLSGSLGALLGGLRFARTGTDIHTRPMPNQGILQSAKHALFSGFLVGIISGLIGGLYVGLHYSWSGGLLFGFLFGLSGGVVYGLNGGGEAYIKHFTLRLMFYINGYIPLNYIKFLDYATQRIFLRKVGGGYIFTHQLLMEHFASLTEADIKRLVDSVTTKK